MSAPKSRETPVPRFASQPAPKRRKMFPVTFDPFERRLLDQLAVDTQSSGASVIRYLIVREGVTCKGPLGLAAKRVHDLHSQMMEVRGEHGQPTRRP